MFGNLLDFSSNVQCSKFPKSSSIYLYKAKSPCVVCVCVRELHALHGRVHGAHVREVAMQGEVEVAPLFVSSIVSFECFDVVLGSGD